MGAHPNPPTNRKNKPAPTDIQPLFFYCEPSKNEKSPIIVQNDLLGLI